MAAETYVSFEKRAPSGEEFKKRVSGIVSSFPSLMRECGGKIIGHTYAAKYAKREACRFSA